MIWRGRILVEFLKNCRENQSFFLINYLKSDNIEQSTRKFFRILYFLIRESIKGSVDMGIFNFFIVIPQITAASILGFMVRNLFGGEAIYALIAGGVSMIIAAVLVTWVDDVDEVK